MTVTVRSVVRRGLPFAVVALVAAAVGGTAASGAPAPHGGTLPSGWGVAQADPTLLRLNATGQATVTSVSCPGADECTAVGLFSDWHYRSRPFTMQERGGIWGPARELTGFQRLDVGWRGDQMLVSCGSPGNCAAAGLYGTAGRHALPFVADEVDGVWQPARAVIGLPALSTTQDAEVNSISCAAAGSCVVGGNLYVGGATTYAGFLDDEVGGVWQPVQLVTGVDALNPGAAGETIDSVSCRASGACTAVGEYEAPLGPGAGDDVDIGVFAMGESSGTWGPPSAVPGLALLPGYPEFPMWEVACAAPGDCELAGTSQQSGGLVAEEHDGTWGTAAALSMRGTVAAVASVTALACPREGYCTAGGSASAASGLAYVDHEVAGVWQPAVAIPGFVRLPWLKPDVADPSVTSIACPIPTACALIGDYDTSHNTQSAFLAVESKGRWSAAEPVPGTWAWDRWFFVRGGQVACGAPGRCVAGGGAVLDSIQPPKGFDEEAFLDTYGPIPVVRSLSTTSGPRRGGTRLVVYGSGFEGQVVVRFGKDPARVLAVLDRGAIEVVTPRGRGAETVSVTTDAGTSPGGAATHFRFR